MKNIITRLKILRITINSVLVCSIADRHFRTLLKNERGTRYSAFMCNVVNCDKGRWNSLILKSYSK